MDDAIMRDSRKCVDLVCRCCGYLCRLMNRILARTGVNVPLCTAMSVLKERGEMMMGELARELDVSMGAGTNLVDRLLELGYVERMRSESDRRVVKVRMTPEGLAARERDIETLTRFWYGIVEQLTPEERAGFFATYDKILAAADNAPAQES
ncbi:MAG TPA: MarR family transcriptional regulator [Planctomycetota bacterium]|nr:MarR family transcriptional regulator [Planctomycetota bacterium]